jgi:hypothetical protein
MAQPRDNSPAEDSAPEVVAHDVDDKDMPCVGVGCPTHYIEQ